MRIGSTAAIPTSPEAQAFRPVGTSGYLLLGSAVAGMAGNALLGGPCGLRLATGHFCALCGGTRAFRALVSGDLFEAGRMNAVVTVSLIAAVVALAAAAFGPGARATVNRALAGTLDLTPRRVILVIAIWTVLRNLPGLEMLRPPA